MAFRYVVKKRVFGFDKSKSEKYVAASFSVVEISYDKLCDQVTKEGMAPRGLVKAEVKKCKKITQNARRSPCSCCLR